MSAADKKRLVYRVLVYILGLFCLAMGVAISVNSELGVSPVNSLPYVLSRISGAAMSTCVILVFTCYVALQALVLRREFKLVSLTQLAFSVIFGYFVDFSKRLIGGAALPGYAGRLVMLAVSILLVAVGVLLYVKAGLVPMPMEGLSLALAGKVGLPFHNMKVIVDCAVVAVGAALCFVFLDRLDGIREGTVITALLVGRLMALLRPGIDPVIHRLCFPQEAAAE